MMIIRKIILVLLLITFFGCTNKQVIQRNKNHETSFKDILYDSIHEGTIPATRLFEEEDSFYVFTPYFPLKEITKQIDDFRFTYYYLQRKESDYMFVHEGSYLIISTKDNQIKKCMLIDRNLFSFERLKSNIYVVDKTNFLIEPHESKENSIKVKLVVDNNN